MIRHFLLLVLIIFSINLSAQESKEWAERLNALEVKLDPNNKRFELQELNKALHSIWKSDTELNEIMRHTKKLQVVKSEDLEMVVVAFGTNTYSGVYQLEWLVSYAGKSWSYSEEVQITEAKSNVPLIINITQKQEDIYSVSIHRGKKQLISASDMVTKGLFEDLQMLTEDTQKDSLNNIIEKQLMRLWTDKEYYENTFSQLKRMKTLHSKDGRVKVCTYNIQKEGFKQQFYGAVIINDESIIVKPLTDTSDKIKSPERSTLSDKKWYGALYLDMIETQSGNQTYYTLIGYKGHDEFMKRRVLDVLIVQNNRIRFGAPVFKTDRLTRNRVVFEYSAKATMMLRYDTNQKMIVFDNLAPADPMFRGVYQYYGPDFSYNAFKFSKGVWELKKDIDLRNPKRQ
ncbi:hypothetical protein KEM09_13400 [Carboxylicivirga mesophila]|uniref:DUF4468 domain-containing protein n=1 Tax=Carboxylicivirga mesophila TaxID=1166478 RepID=A0ABS5KBP3_9BACT|nr:hypothetical protein [Carboxylicivirga mesophila]MBS2212406.1 hypothetical protein [Carboxylicivirga mesophila]